MTIREEYEEAKKKLDELSKLVREEELKKSNLEKKMHEINMFKISHIGEIIAKLLTVITGEKYIFDAKTCCEKVVKYSCFEVWREEKRFSKIFIVKESLNIDATKPIDSSLEESGEFILLRMINSYASIEKILKIDLNELLEKKFPLEINFISDFIFKLIKYRVDNNLVNINFEDIEYFLNNYLGDNQEALVEHYRKNKRRVVYLVKK